MAPFTPGHGFTSLSLRRDPPPGHAPPPALPEHIQRQIEHHPCYSEAAHHHFARLHLAVAPACNIQCHYCNRKYDCANEARPGVVSSLLTPEQAVQKALVVAAELPQLAVIGIAGPGDPLANPEHTFATFRALSEKAPDLKLCLSTNGLRLPAYVDELVKHNIGHVTITINCLDADIGARIYPWIFWQHRRLRGRQAAAILIEQQQRGLELLVARGVLVKINSVLIPGVNDQHLTTVNRVVREKGAFLHNIVPLLARREHGTYYGVMGQPEPTFQQLHAVQEACGGESRMMRHCRQCRSDAIGLLGQDRQAEFGPERIAAVKVDHQTALVRRREVHGAIHRQLTTHRAAVAEGTAASPSPVSTRPVLMAVASRGEGLINQHFGQAQEFLIYEASASGVRLLGTRKATDPYCHGPETCEEDSDSKLARALRALQGCEVLLCARIGIVPWQQLEAAGIQPNSEHALQPIETAIRAVYEELWAAGQLAMPAGIPQAANGRG